MDRWNEGTGVGVLGGVERRNMDLIEEWGKRSKGRGRRAEDVPAPSPDTLARVRDTVATPTPRDGTPNVHVESLDALQVVLVASVVVGGRPLIPRAPEGFSCGSRRFMSTCSKFGRFRGPVPSQPTFPRDHTPA